MYAYCNKFTLMLLVMFVTFRRYDQPTAPDACHLHLNLLVFFLKVNHAVAASWWKMTPHVLALSLAVIPWLSFFPFLVSTIAWNFFFYLQEAFSAPDLQKERNFGVQRQCFLPPPPLTILFYTSKVEPLSGKWTEDGTGGNAATQPHSVLLET